MKKERERERMGDREREGESIHVQYIRAIVGEMDRPILEVIVSLTNTRAQAHVLGVVRRGYIYKDAE